MATVIDSRIAVAADELIRVQKAEIERLREQLFNCEQQVIRAEKERDRFRSEADTKGACWGSAEKHLAECKAEVEALQSDPALHFCHRLAVVLECMTLGNSDALWAEATNLLAEYQDANAKWREAMGEPYVSGFGKD